MHRAQYPGRSSPMKMRVRRLRISRRETGLAADDPVRFGAGRLLDAVLAPR